MEFYDGHRIALNLFPRLQQSERIIEERVQDVDDIYGDVQARPDNTEDLYSTERQKFDSECSEYIEFLKEDVKSNGKSLATMLNRNPLELQWPALKKRTPMLFVIARTVLAIPASIAGSERFFSRLTNIITKMRNRFQPELAGNIVTHSMRSRAEANQTKEKTLMKLPVFGQIESETICIGEWDEDEFDEDYSGDEDSVASERAEDSIDVSGDVTDVFEDVEIVNEEVGGDQQQMKKARTDDLQFSDTEAVEVVSTTTA